MFGKFSKDMGIDLGTSNTLVYVKDNGIVINEPSVVAINTRTDSIIAVGEEARQMVGKTPTYIIATRPMEGGVISDFEVTERMLKFFIDKVHSETMSFIPRPRVVISIPLGLTEVERKAVEDATLHAGAREIHLIEQPMAAAVGARLPIQDASGTIVVNIGGGTTEIAVLSLGGVVNWKSIRIAGNELDRNIMQFVREHFNLLLGERTAEDLKIKIGSALEMKDPMETKIRGRDLITGLPKEISITSNHIHQALARSLGTIVETIRNTIESTPPELVADIYERGVVLTGGSALLRGLDKAISDEIKVPVHIADEPLTTVVRGAGIVLEDFENLKNVLIGGTKEERLHK